MATDSSKTKGAKSAVATTPLANSKFHAQIVFKSGAIQDLLIVAEFTDCFEKMRVDFLKYISSGVPKGGFYTLGSAGLISIDWRDVSSFREWFD